MTDLVGRTIAGRYRVDAFLGKGGMAEVYKVWDPRRSVSLAMKVLQADLAEDKVFVRRFRREGQTLAKLQHPNIVRFYGLEQEDNLVFMLMDFVDGTTLRREIFKTREAFPLGRVLQIMQPVCAALHYAHESGIIHCDVKPANIMINALGQVLVSDFGIARLSESSTSTLAGAGTPAYMAPEQVKGESPSPQTDIYALGVVLYELLTGGERPFTGENAKTTGSTSEKIRWEHVRRQPPSPRIHNPDLSAGVEAIVLRCLEKQPAARYRTSLQLLAALQDPGAARAAVGTDSAAHARRKRAGAKKEAASNVAEDSRPPRTSSAKRRHVAETPAAAPAADQVQAESGATHEPDSRSVAVPPVPSPASPAGQVPAGVGQKRITMHVFDPMREQPSPALQEIPRRKHARRSPWAGWLVAGILITVSGWLALRGAGQLETAVMPATTTARPASSTTQRASPSATPRPVQLGDVVEYKGLRFAVLDLFPHDRVYTGDGYYHDANPGHMLIDLFVRIENLRTYSTLPVSISWRDIRITYESGEFENPSYAGAAFVAAGEEIDPFDIRTDITVKPNDSIDIPKVAYVRLYFFPADKGRQKVWFAIGDSRAVELLIVK